MDKKIKHTFKVYAAWDYGFEEQEFNRMSEKGWQLISGGCFHQRYEFDDSVVYRYRIDFNNKIDSMERYDETFRDAGWERVSSTFNDWHIFRKVYDPGLPEEKYEIYTDEPSRVEMLRRWRNTAVISVIFVASTAINPLIRAFGGEFPLFGTAAMMIMYASIAFMEISAFAGINNLIKGRKNKRRFNFSLFFGTLILTLAVFLASSFLRTANEANAWFSFGILAGLLIMAIAVFIAEMVGNKRKNG